MPALKGPKVVVKAKSFDIRNLKDLVTAPRPQLNNSVVANLTSELVGARESMANLTSGLSELEDEHEAVAVDLDELEQGYEDVVSNMTRNVQEMITETRSVLVYPESCLLWWSHLCCFYGNKLLSLLKDLC